MWATDQPFAERWATRGRYRRLPEKVEGKAVDEGPPAGKPTTAAPATNEKSPAADGATRKPMTPQERARHAALVRWGKKNPLAARLAALREKKKGGGGGGGGAAAKPKPAAPDKAAEKEAEQAKNLAAAGEALMAGDAPLSKKGLDALAAFAKGGTLDPDTAKELSRLGVVTLGEDGTPRLNPDGKRIVAAAQKGDMRGVVDAAFAAGEKVGVGAAGETLPGWETFEDGSRARKPDPADAEKDKEKPKGGGGGGGGGGGKEEEKPPEEGKEGEQPTDPKAAARAERAAATGEKAGLKPGEVDALRRASESGEVDEAEIDGLAELGLVEADGKGGFITTDQGRRALSALERGDVRGYRAALQDVDAKRGRDKAKADKEQGRASERAEKDQARATEQAARDEERGAREAARGLAKREQEAQELDDLADDFRRGRRGLSFDQQRKLIRAGRARLNGEKFELKAQKPSVPNDPADKKAGVQVWHHEADNKYAISIGDWASSDDIARMKDRFKATRYEIDAEWRPSGDGWQPLKSPYPVQAIKRLALELDLLELDDE
jgi:hypothetical protein